MTRESGNVTREIALAARGSCGNLQEMRRTGPCVEHAGPNMAANKSGASSACGAPARPGHSGGAARVGPVGGEQDANAKQDGASLPMLILRDTRTGGSSSAQGRVMK